MPDISMCKNETCPSRFKCYRYQATPSKYLQCYASFAPKDGEDKCDYFWATDREFVNAGMSIEEYFLNIEENGKIYNKK